MTTGTDLPDFVTYKIYTSDKVNSILSATLQHLDSKQIITLRDSLIERTPPLASEEISRLKEENERLRGALSELYDVVFKGENVFKSLDKAHEVLNKPNITIVQSKNK